MGRMLHTPWWTSGRNEDGTLTITRYDGKTYTGPSGCGLLFAAAIARIDREEPLDEAVKKSFLPAREERPRPPLELAVDNSSAGTWPDLPG